MESLPTHLEHRVRHRPASSKTADWLSRRFCPGYRVGASHLRVVRIVVGFEQSAAVWSVSDDRI